jgi:hypothetical protein
MKNVRESCIQLMKLILNKHVIIFIMSKHKFDMMDEIFYLIVIVTLFFYIIYI